MVSEWLEISGTKAEFSPSPGTAGIWPETQQLLKDLNLSLPLKKSTLLRTGFGGSRVGFTSHNHVVRQAKVLRDFGEDH